MASRIQPILTVADLDSYPDDGNRYELIEGELFVSRAPGIPHQLVLNNLQIECGAYLKQNPVGRFVPGAGAVFSDYDAVIPDLAFVVNERWDQVVTGEKFTGALDIVIEVISPGDLAYEVDEKIAEYLEAGVALVWEINPEKRTVFVHRADGSVAKLKENDTLSGEDVIPGFACRVGELFPPPAAPATATAATPASP